MASSQGDTVCGSASGDGLDEAFGVDKSELSFHVGKSTITDDLNGWFIMGTTKNVGDDSSLGCSTPPPPTTVVHVEWCQFVDADVPGTIEIDGFTKPLHIVKEHDWADGKDFQYLREAESFCQLVVTSCSVIGDERGGSRYDPATFSAVAPSLSGHTQIETEVTSDNSYRITNGGWHSANSTGSSSAVKQHPAILSNGDQAYLEPTLKGCRWKDVDGTGGYERTVTFTIEMHPEEEARHAKRGVWARELVFHYDMDPVHAAHANAVWDAMGRMGRGQPRAPKRRLYSAEPDQMASSKKREGDDDATAHWVRAWCAGAKRMTVGFGTTHKTEFRLVPKNHRDKFDTLRAPVLRRLGVRYVKMRTKALETEVGINWGDVMTRVFTTARKRVKRCA